MDVSDPAEDDSCAVQDAGLWLDLQATAVVTVYKLSPVHLREKHHMRSEDQDRYAPIRGSISFFFNDWLVDPTNVFTKKRAFMCGSLIHSAPYSVGGQ